MYGQNHFLIGSGRRHSTSQNRSIRFSTILYSHNFGHSTEKDSRRKRKTKKGLVPSDSRLLPNLAICVFAACRSPEKTMAATTIMKKHLSEKAQMHGLKELVANVANESRIRIDDQQDER